MCSLEDVCSGLAIIAMKKDDVAPGQEPRRLVLTYNGQEPLPFFFKSSDLLIKSRDLLRSAQGVTPSSGENTGLSHKSHKSLPNYNQHTICAYRTTINTPYLGEERRLVGR